MKQSIKEKIWYLFFERLYNKEQIVEYFKNKYTYQQISFVIDEKY